MTVGNFEVHLKNRVHREKVDMRMAKTAGQGAAQSSGNGSTS